jgi:hypothetical protein
MSEVNDGGYVYPSEQGETSDGTWNQTYDPGITRRDWLAGMAITAVIAEINTLTIPEYNKWLTRLNARNREDLIAKVCYARADAMIAEGQKGQPSDNSHDELLEAAEAAQNLLNDEECWIWHERKCDFIEVNTILRNAIAKAKGEAK